MMRSMLQCVLVGSTILAAAAAWAGVPGTKGPAQPSSCESVVAADAPGSIQLAKQPGAPGKQGPKEGPAAGGRPDYCGQTEADCGPWCSQNSRCDCGGNWRLVDGCCECDCNPCDEGKGGKVRMQTR